MTTVAFLHIPKTAGQTIHNEISRVIGADLTSPVRVHTQAKGPAQYPQGYRFYSGHLDWTDLDLLPQDRFVFTVLRDPRERIASFYFYLLQEAGKLDPAQMEQPKHTGQRTIATHSADDYFFGGDAKWQRFINDHYDNFYCSYLASRKMRGRLDLAGLDPVTLRARALSNAAGLNHVYSAARLDRLEDDLLKVLGAPVNLVQTRHNTGALPEGVARWPLLLQRFERDKSRSRLEAFVRHDDALMTEITLR